MYSGSSTTMVLLQGCRILNVLAQVDSGSVEASVAGQHEERCGYTFDTFLRIF